MTIKIIFQDSLLVSGIMCAGGCGNTIRNLLYSDFDEAKRKGQVPEDAELMIDPEAHALGLYRFTFFIRSASEDVSEENLQSVFQQFKNTLNSADFSVIDKTDENDKTKYWNWLNIAINLLTMGIIIGLWFFLPPSLPLTIGFIALSFLSTAFTARKYLLNFFRQLRYKENLATMNTTVSLGWFFSFVHTLYHSISMPLVGSFSMLFMGFIMPPVLLTFINGMDEIKRQVTQKSKKIHLQGMRTLFPQMAEEYPCCQLSSEEMRDFTQIELPLPETEVLEKKGLLKKGMIITVQQGQCFPVDCVLMQGNTIVDASLINGETREAKQPSDPIPQGALNRGQTVRVYATEDCYNSTINQIMFGSNRAKQNEEPVAKKNKFTYLYAALIITSLVVSIIVPPIFGIFALAFILQNITGILCAACPCNLILGDQFPIILGINQRNNKGILLRDERSSYESGGEIQTVVFDKTGTLTTGDSRVDTYEGISPSLWDKIYLLEKKYAAEHQIAKAIIQHHGLRANHQFFNEIRNVTCRSNGIGAEVQGVPVYLGNAQFLTDQGINIPAINHDKIEQGLTPVYVAEAGQYKGVIYIRHEVRKEVKTALARLKHEGKKIIMLTGDHSRTAKSFNRQIGSLFAAEGPNPEIFADQKPKDKEEFLRQLTGRNLQLVSELPANKEPYRDSYLLLQNQNEETLYYINSDTQIENVPIKNLNPLKTALENKKKRRLTYDEIKTMITAQGGDNPPNLVDPKGVWFVGDGLNDAPCSRLVSELGGKSCSISANEQASFFTDISLNGSLDYLFVHNKINSLVRKSRLQNQGLLALSTLSFLAFVFSFSFAGIAVSPLIPVFIMFITTSYLFFNSYRIQLAIDVELDKHSSWLKKLLASDFSLALLVVATSLLICSVLIATAVTGGLALPFFTFTAGAALAVSSAFTLSACVLFSCFACLALAYVVESKEPKQLEDENTEMEYFAPVATSSSRFSSVSRLEPQQNVVLSRNQLLEEKSRQGVTPSSVACL